MLLLASDLVLIPRRSRAPLRLVRRDLLFLLRLVPAQHRAPLLLWLAALRVALGSAMPFAARSCSSRGRSCAGIQVFSHEIGLLTGVRVGLGERARHYLLSRLRTQHFKQIIPHSYLIQSIKQ